MIVDDNDANRKLARDLLSAGGFQTLEAASGAEAIALTLARAPDIVLMDLRLPDMDGMEAARRLKGDMRTARIPVVALSALPLEGNDDWLEAAGFAGWLEKPIHVGTFAEQVRGYCPEPSA
jgi:CheY-like chemotaxis protein